VQPGGNLDSARQETESTPQEADTFHFNTQVKVRLPETDAMGIVFHGNYFTYLEVGRVDYLLNLDLAEGLKPIREFENVVVAAHLDFKSPARLHDLLRIDVCTREIGKSSFTFGFRIRHMNENRVVALGYTTHCAIDEDFRPIEVPQNFRATIARYEGWKDCS
jgi:acyl-CoA thioester hydrolase